MLNHLLISALYGFVVLFPLFLGLFFSVVKFVSPIMGKTYSTKREAFKKMAPPAIGMVIFAALFGLALFFLGSDTFSNLTGATSTE